MQRDLLTNTEIHKLVTDAGYIPEESINSIAVRAARLGAERAMQAPDGDLPAMLADPALDRLRDWYEIGPAQRAAVDTLVGWVRERERERAARVCETLAENRLRKWEARGNEEMIEQCKADAWNAAQCAAAIGRGA